MSKRGEPCKANHAAGTSVGTREAGLAIGGDSNILRPWTCIVYRNVLHRAALCRTVPQRAAACRSVPPQRAAAMYRNMCRSAAQLATDVPWTCHGH